jgi:hypothetical protein
VAILILGSSEATRCAMDRFEAAERYLYEQRCEATVLGREALLDSFAEYLDGH